MADVVHTIRSFRLKRLYENSGNRCVAIYGRRRVGKTALMMKFCEDKNYIRFQGSSGNFNENLNLIKLIIQDKGYSADNITDMFSFMKILGKICSEEQIVIILDEYPEFARIDGNFPSLLQDFIDTVLSKTNSFLLVSGSSISAMKSELEDPTKPLFGRFMNFWELKQLTYLECREFTQSMNDKEAMDLYCILGGIPAYYDALTSKIFDECLWEDILSQNSLFGNEIRGLILRELTPLESYYSILSAIAYGCTSVNLISDRTGIDQPLCSKYLSNLSNMGIISIKNPMYGTNKKSKNFYIDDRFTDWYFSVVAKNETVLETKPRVSAEKLMHNDIDTYLGRGFEHVCMEYIKQKYVCREVGSWWGKADGEVTDIDIVAKIDIDGVNVVLAAECKYRNRNTDSDVLEKLMRRASNMKTTESIHYVIFSKLEFTEDIRDMAERYDVDLVNLKDMYAVNNKNNL